MYPRVLVVRRNVVPTVIDLEADREASINKEGDLRRQLDRTERQTSLPAYNGSKSIFLPLL